MRRHTAWQWLITRTDRIVVRLDVTLSRGERPLAHAASHRRTRAASSCARSSSPSAIREPRVMTSTIPSQGTRAVAVSAEFFGALRASAERNPETVGALRDAGLPRAFRCMTRSRSGWMSAGEVRRPSADDQFGPLLGEFPALRGLGRVARGEGERGGHGARHLRLGGGHGRRRHVVCIVSCGHGTAGGILGRVANAPLAVLEVECRSAGDQRCRFLVGSVDVLNYVYEAMERGVPYDRAAVSAATG
jgi:hypothetical protein